MKLKVSIVSAEKALFSGEAAMVVATAHFGEVGILPGHAPLLASLKPGQVRVVSELQHGYPAVEEVFYVSGGTIEVQPNSVVILADTAERAADLDAAAAQEAMRQAEQFLSEQHDEFDYAKARAELVHAAAQLAAIAKLRDRSKH
jgi:F-type H+-transporting ATPase subunit epsilon